MDCRFCDLRRRDVINICTGNRMGRVCDALIDLKTGRIAALIVPGPDRFLGCFGREDDYILPWACITPIGRDVILVDGKCDIRRDRRPKWGGWGAWNGY